MLAKARREVDLRPENSATSSLCTVKKSQVIKGAVPGRKQVYVRALVSVIYIYVHILDRYDEHLGGAQRSQRVRGLRWKKPCVSGDSGRSQSCVGGHGCSDTFPTASSILLYNR